VGLALTIGGYLLGSILPAVWIVRRKKGRSPWELRDNPGGSGVWRLAGPTAGLTTILFDIVKGVIPVALAQRAGLEGFWFVAATCGPVIGHNWPIYTRFRGGRGLACATGILFYMAWRDMLPAYLAGAVVALAKRWVPAVGVVAFPLGLLTMYLRPVEPLVLTASLSVVLLVAVRQVPWLVTSVIRR
jgi:glycerol-3-phosphate acyltransferase PlsY